MMDSEGYYAWCVKKAKDWIDRERMLGRLSPGQLERFEELIAHLEENAP